MTRHRVRLVLLALAVAASACQTDGMRWRREDVITITSPGLREAVEMPVLVTWEPSPDLADQIAQDPGGILYGIFVDRAPIGRGAQLADVVGRNCSGRGGCMDEESLRDRGIHVSAIPQLLLADLDDLRRRGDPDGRDVHAVTIVVLRRGDDREDGGLALERADETSYRVEFVVEREEEA